MNNPSLFHSATLGAHGFAWWMLFLPFLAGLVVFSPLIIFWRFDVWRHRLAWLAGYFAWLVCLTLAAAVLDQQVGEAVLLIARAFDALIPRSYFGLWLLAIPVFIILAVLAPWTVLQRREGRRKRLLDSTRNMGFVLIAGFVFYHGERACDRAFVTPRQCRTHGPSPDGAYDVEVCLTRGSSGVSPEGVVNLRAFKGGEVLARRMFYNEEYGRVRWSSDEVIVGSADGRAEFQLPPGRWEKWLTFLP